MKLPLLIVLTFVTACDGGLRDRSTAAESRGEVAAAMARYQQAVRTVDPDAISAFYTEDGTLFEPGIAPIASRASIRAFVASFPGVTVDSATATPDIIDVYDGTAYLWGSYFERLSFPGQPVSEQHGRFIAEWVRQADGAWLIKRHFRVPIETAFPGG